MLFASAVNNDIIGNGREKMFVVMVEVHGSCLSPAQQRKS
jgi:hypothetical protein